MASSQRRMLNAWWVLVSACSASMPSPSAYTVTPTQVATEVDTRITVSADHLGALVVYDFDRPEKSSVDASLTLTLSGPTTVTLREPTLVRAGAVQGIVPAGTPVGVYALRVEQAGHLTLAIDPGIEVTCARCGAADASVGDSGVDAGTDAGCSTLTWPDQDDDGYGSGASAYLCGAHRSTVAGDCNDFDALTSPVGVEVCNGLDDNCDSRIDEGVCTRDAGWRVVSIASTTTWRTASSWQTGALWVGGSNQQWVQLPDSGVFLNASLGCPSNLVSSAANTVGEASMGGGTLGMGRISWASAAMNDAGCVSTRSTLDPLVGIAWFDSGFVGATRTGRLARWRGTEAPLETPTNLAGSTRLEDVHGSSATRLFAVGADNADDSRMKVFSLGADGGWLDEKISVLPGSQQGALHGLWVTPNAVVTVGDEGFVARRTAEGWQDLSLESGTLRSVIAFGASRIYVVDLEGRIRRFDGQRWQTLSERAQDSYYDIAGTSEDDLWVVGSNGVVLHWP